MHRLRAQLVLLGPAVAALFTLSIAAPHAGVFYHEHAGGAQAHVHPDDDGVIAELLGEYSHTHEHGAAHHHPHDVPPHHHAAAARPSAAAKAASAFEHDDGPITGHWHEQQRFHRAIVVGAPLLLTVTSAGAALQPAPIGSNYVAALDLHARAPPHSPLS